jgi:hypothetical protein
MAREMGSAFFTLKMAISAAKPLLRMTYWMALRKHIMIMGLYVARYCSKTGALQTEMS